MLKDKTFDIEGSEQVNIACSLSKSNVERMEGLFPTILHNYNFETNEIGNETTNSSAIAAYCSGLALKNQNNIAIRDAELYTRDYSDWNNNMNLYSSSFSSLKDNNGLIVNIHGAMSVNPGWKCGVAVQSIQESTWWTNGPSLYQKATKDVYKQLEGGWYISKVVHLINPMKKKFRQNLYLMRNENTVP